MELKNVIKERRALRSLKKVEFEEQEIKKIFSLAQLAPSCFNKQPWKFIFVKSKTKLDLVYNTLSSGNRWALNASGFVIVLSEKGSGCVLKDGREYYLYDTGIISGFLMLLFTEHGFIAHPIAGFNQAKIKKNFNLPEEVVVISLIVLGKKKIKLDKNLTEGEKLVEKQRPERYKLERILKIM